MNRFWLKMTLTVATTVWSAVALAQSTSTTVPSSADPSAAPQSVTDAEVVGAKKKKLPIGLSTDSTIWGPRVNTPDANKITTDTNNKNESFDGIYLRQKIAGKYAIDDKTAIKPTLDFDFQLTDPEKEKTGIRQFRWRDSYVTLSRKSLIETNLKGNDVALDGDVRWFVPSSEKSRMNNTVGAARLSLNPSIQIGKSPLSFSMANYAKYWFQTRNNDIRKADKHNANGANTTPLAMFEMYSGPQVNYAFTDKVTAFVLYEGYVNFDTSGMPNSKTKKDISLIDVEPGVNLQLHDRVSVTPFLNWFTNQPLYTTTFNLNAAFTLL